MPFKLKANARGIVICQKSGKFKYWKIKITFIQGILFCFFVTEEKKSTSGVNYDKVVDFDPCMGHSLKRWTWSLWVSSNLEYSVILPEYANSEQPFTRVYLKEVVAKNVLPKITGALRSK